MRWTEERYQEHMRNLDRGSYLGVMGKELVTRGMETVDPGPESVLQGRIMKWAKDKGYPCQ